MLNRSDSSLPPPAIQQIAKMFRLTGWVGFWVQLVLGVVSALILLFAAISREDVSTQVRTAGTGLGIFFSSCGLVVLAVSIYWAFRYTQIAKQLASPSRPRKEETLNLVQLGLLVSLGGMLVAILAGWAIAGSLTAKSLAQPQGALISASSIPLIRPLDIFVVQANINTIAAHFAGVLTSLWLLRWLTRPHQS
ncbi:hypothetical protein DO97_05625 [Neosynechococcus sphagnicola sy1]|uniref:DUF3611 family protein n=1 Tax=Neosynechococcus sphagnicola sy1 TaxID=1497020 RepID=A0A098TNL7_9CYAN|nr:DUF3611 family protein [Neosynechococcus sphagnicola]KGF73856.1 hypothetical protein DO97_05625 [Neosynechococcus sphagnicola sy1]